MLRPAAIVCVWLTLLLGSADAHAQSLAAGTIKYQHGDCPGAERALSSALRTATGADVKAKIYKLMGICQYADGDQAAAKTSFRKALALSPNLTVVPTEVIDESVVDFFNQQKPKAAKASPAADAATAAAGPSAADLGIPPDDANGPGGPGGAGAPGAAAGAGNDGAALTDGGTPSGDAAAAPKKKKKKKKKRATADVVDAELGSDKPAAAPSAYGDDAPPSGGDEAAKPDDAADDGTLSFAAPKKDKGKSGDSASATEYRTPRRVLVDLLPLGAGQYQNGEYLLGAGFSVTQAYSFYIYYSRTKAIAKAQAQGKSLVADRRANNEELSPADQAYLASTLSYEQQQQQQAKYGEVGLGLLWAASTIEALLFTPPSSGHDRIKRRKIGYVPDVEYLPGPGLGQVQLAWSF